MSDSKDFYPETHAAFRFVVKEGSESLGAFTECTVPTIEWETEEIKEGGLNTYVHQRPVRRKAARLILKNGIGKSTLIDWYFATMDENLKRKELTVTLLDSLSNEVMVWTISDAFPAKWMGPPLKTDTNTVAIQTLEFVCGLVSVDYNSKKAGSPVN